MSFVCLHGAPVGVLVIWIRNLIEALKWLQLELEWVWFLSGRVRPIIQTTLGGRQSGERGLPHGRVVKFLLKLIDNLIGFGRIIDFVNWLAFF